MTKSPKAILIFTGFLIAGLIFVLALVLLLRFQTSLVKKPDAEIASTGNVSKLNLTYVEIADSESETSKGLMNRKDLCESCGMLFVFKNSQYRSFWMKNTFIPLDIIFINSDGKINSISQNAEPLNEEKRYNSKEPSQYVLEVNAGFTKKYNIQVGDNLKIEEILKEGKEFNNSY